MGLFVGGRDESFLSEGIWRFEMQKSYATGGFCLN